jgi:hypothetical protein
MKCKNKLCKSKSYWNCEGYCERCYKDMKRVRQLNLIKDFEEKEQKKE